MSRFKDGRILTAIRLSPDERVKLQALADQVGEPKSAWIRREINRAYDRLEKRGLK